MELQLGKQKRMMYARVFDRTEEETCSADAVVPDALGDIGAIVVTEGTFCLWNLDFSDKSAQIEGSVAAGEVARRAGGARGLFAVGAGDGAGEAEPAGLPGDGACTHGPHRGRWRHGVHAHGNAPRAGAGVR